MSLTFHGTVSHEPAPAKDARTGTHSVEASAIRKTRAIRPRRLRLGQYTKKHLGYRIPV